MESKMKKIQGRWACDCLIDSTYLGVQYSTCADHEDFDILEKIGNLKNKLEILKHLS